MTASNLTTILLAMIAILPACIAAYVGIQNSKKLQTNSGKTIGAHIETIHEEIAQLHSKIEALESKHPEEE